MTADSQHPLYKLGFRRGRALTEAEVAAQKLTYSERWNRVYLTLLPVAMQVEGWRLGNTAVTSTADRVTLAKLWTDEAVKFSK